MSNHADLSFTDEEVITIYMFGIIDKKVALKEIYVPAKNYWSDWFPNLPTYVAFVQVSLPKIKSNTFSNHTMLKYILLIIFSHQ